MLKLLNIKQQYKSQYSNYLQLLNTHAVLFKNSKQYYFHCNYHLGDSVFNILWLNTWKTYIENNNITIYYYTLFNYIDQLQEFVLSSNINIIPLKYRPEYSIHLWMGNPQVKQMIRDAIDTSVNVEKTLDKYLSYFYNFYLQKLNVNIPLMHYFAYVDPTLLELYEMLDAKYKKVDVLVINSVPRSNQYVYDETEWNNFIIQTAKSGLKVVYTTSTPAITASGVSCSCTMDDNLTLKSIAAISTRSKIIVAVNSGVMPGILNVYTLKNGKQMYIFDNIWHYSYRKVQYKKSPLDISVHELFRFASTQ